MKNILAANQHCTIELGNPTPERYVRICHLCQLRYNSWLSEKTFGFLIAFVTMFPICFYMPRFFEMRSKEDIKVIFTGLDILYRHLNNRRYKIAKLGLDTDSFYKIALQFLAVGEDFWLFDSICHCVPNMLLYATLL